MAPPGLVAGMIYHKRTEHFDEKPFSCGECGAKFAANSSLKNHTRLHTGEKPYCCKHCNMAFSVAAALAYHTKKKHSEGNKRTSAPCWPVGGALPSPFGLRVCREDVRVPVLQSRVRPVDRADASRAHAHRRPAVRVSGVR